MADLQPVHNAVPRSEIAERRRLPPEVVDRIVHFVAPPCLFAGKGYGLEPLRRECSCAKTRKVVAPLAGVSSDFLAAAASRVYRHLGPRELDDGARCAAVFASLASPHGDLYCSMVTCVVLFDLKDILREEPSPRATGAAVASVVPRFGRLDTLLLPLEEGNEFATCIRIMEAARTLPVRRLALRFGAFWAGTSTHGVERAMRGLDHLEQFCLMEPEVWQAEGFGSSSASLLRAAPAQLLDLAVVVGVDREALAAISRLHKLRSLDIALDDNLAEGAECIPFLAPLVPSLERLPVKGSWRSGEPAEFDARLASMISSGTSLRELELTYWDVADGALGDAVRELPELDSLILAELSADDGTLDALSRSVPRTVRRLVLTVFGGTAFIRAILARLPGLESVTIAHENIGTACLAAVSSLRRLRHLDVSTSTLRHPQLALAASRMPSLETLRKARCAFVRREARTRRRLRRAGIRFATYPHHHYEECLSDDLDWDTASVRAWKAEVGWTGGAEGGIEGDSDLDVGSDPPSDPDDD